MYDAQLVMLWSLAIGMAIAVLLVIVYFVGVVIIEILDARDAARQRARVAKYKLSSEYGKGTVYPRL